VIGGLFTSTVLTLVLVPVLYSLASRFAGRRSTAELDAMLDAAGDRRFHAIGLRSTTPPAPAPLAEYAFTLTLEPEPGKPGDRKVLEILAQNGLKVEPVAGTAKVRLGIRGVKARSVAEASAEAREAVRGLLPARGYTLSDPEPVETEEKQLVPA
jgi:hypothetical protein